MTLNKVYISEDKFVNLNEPIDISIPLDPKEGPLAFHIPAPKFEPIQVGNFIGSVALGGSANCENLMLNAHGNGTHTECLGHISKERITINQCLKKFHFLGLLITVNPKKIANGDYLIDEQIVDLTQIPEGTESLIIRTLPNSSNKLTANYSGNNPCYFDPKLTAAIRLKGIKHLIIDLPSVDREEDEGALAAHHAYWDYPTNPRYDCTITEMVYVKEEIVDDHYFVNIQIASFESDASPSKIILYKIN